jgi:aerotolerance regulator-like protein/VWA domain-containing protein
MSFLNSSLMLWLAPLLGLPLLIHLLNKKFPKLFRFSSVEHIRKTIAQRSKLFRLRHLILAMVRTLAVLLLLLAFLKPVREMFGSNQSQRGPRDVVIVFDHSLSMECKDGGVSGRKRAVIEAEKIIDTLGTNDLLNVIAVERNPNACFTEMSSNQAEALTFLQKLEPGLGIADFNKAGAAAAQQLSKVQGRQEIYFISDFQRKNWANVDFAKLPASARLFFVNVASNTRPNRAIVGARIDQPAALAGETVPLEISIGNFSDEPFAGKAEVLLDGKAAFEASVSAGAWAVSKVTMPIRLGAPGAHTIEIKIPDDNLPQDNHFFLATNVMEKEQVAVVSDETGGEKRAAFFLSKAINPYENNAGSLVPKHLNSAQLSGVQLVATRKVFLTNLDRLGEPVCKLLAKFLNDGGGIVYFLDGKFDAENLAGIDKALAGGVPLKLTSKQSAENIPTGAQQILRGDFKSKYLRLFRGSQRQNLALIEFYEFYHALPTGRGNVLLSYADGSPALATANTGLGTLVLCNFSANELSSNIARQRVFPAWIQDLIKCLNSNETPEKVYEVGDEVRAEVWKSELKNNSVKSPSGQAVRTNRELDVNRYQLSFVANEQGIYRLDEGDTLYAFAVNCPADESDLRSVDVDLLPRRLGESQQAHFVEGQEDYRFLNTGKPIFHWFVLGMLGLLVAELGLFKLFKHLAR